MKAIILAVFSLIAFCGLPLLRVVADTQHTVNDTTSWSNPSSMAVLRASSLPSSQNEPNFLNNLDCDIATFRYSSNDGGQTGCFTPTAIGLVDSDAETAIFNGTDEGLPLISYSPHQVLVPWPGTLDMIALDPVLTGGSYISLYKNPFSKLQDIRDLAGQLIAKKLTEPAELPLLDAEGKRLIINPQTLAFSSNGSWLVVEGLSGKFIRINLATLDENPFAPAYGSTGSPALLKSRLSVSDSGRYAAVENDAAESFKVYDLAICSDEICPAYDYWGFLHQQIPGIRYIRHVRFLNEGTISFEIVAADPTKSGTYEMAPREKITSLIDYLGLGDSYTSGEGAYDYRAGTDSADNTCHLSINSYPMLLTRDLFSAAGGHSVACSGAVIRDLADDSPSYRGQTKDNPGYSVLQTVQPAFLASIETNYLPGYISQQRFVSKYQPAIVTVSVGGNDIGFGDMLVACVEPHIKLHASDNVCFSTYEDRLEVLNLIKRTETKWSRLFGQLHREAPNARLYAVGYPDIVSDTGRCGINVHLNQSELEFAKELVDKLNESIQRAALKSNIQYVDVSQALAGHRLCEAANYNTAVNGLTAGKDGGPFGLKIIGAESYHPNALGHRLIEQAILKATLNLSSGTQPPTTKTTDAAFVAKPHSARKVRSRLPAAIASSRVRRGASLRVHAKSELGLRANQPYFVRLDGNVTGTAQSDASGDLDVVVDIPPDEDVGGHVIDLTGNGLGQDEIDVTQPIYIEAGDEDSDNDGISNGADSCSLAANSGLDEDMDGIDDNCDGYIGAPASTGGGPESSVPLNGAGPSVVSVTPSTGSPIVGYHLARPRFASIKMAGNFKGMNILGASTANPQVSGSASKMRNAGYAHSDPWKLKLIPWLKLIVISWVLFVLAAYSLSRRRNDEPVLA